MGTLGKSFVFDPTISDLKVTKTVFKGGHLIPGSFFIMFGIWWGFITAIRYTQMKLKSPFKKGHKLGYNTSVTMPCVCMPCSRLKRAPIESYLKIVLVSIALFLEIYTGFYWYDSHVPINGATTTTSTMAMPPMEHNHEHNHEHKRSATELPQFKIVRKWDIEHGNQQHITMYSAFILGAIVEVFAHYGADIPDRAEFVTGAMAFFIE
jgi:hypothetical protein